MSWMLGPHVRQLNASGILHLYHMVTACDGVYEYWADFIESWHSMLRQWLIRSAFILHVYVCESKYPGCYV